MAILSVFRHSLVNNTRELFSLIATKDWRKPAGVVSKAFSTGQVCHMSGPPTMHIHPSSFQHKKFLDTLHFYIMLGVIPLGTAVFLINIFIGPAQLAEIPEDYEPKHWEYYRHPIERFIARYVHLSPQEIYERKMHYLVEEQKNANWNLLEKKVKNLMKERGDYKGWYFTPYEAGPLRYYRRYFKEVDEYNPESIEDSSK